MEAKFKFKKLLIWQNAMDFGEEIYFLADIFPRKEMYNLSSQTRKIVDAIAINISEGSTGQTNPEYRKFMGYAIRSLAEVVTCLYKSQKRNYISGVQFKTHYEFSFNLMNRTAAFKKTLV